MGNHLAGAILAAGKGERLRKTISGLPKPLVELDGRTLLARQARAIIDAGADPVVAVVNSETASLIRARRVALPAELELCVRDTANSMETLFTIGEKLPRGRFLLATVDAILPRPEFERFVTSASDLTAKHGGSSFDGALAVVKWRGDRRPLFVETGGRDLITAFGDRETGRVTAGLYMFSTGIFRFVEAARSAGLAAMREFLAYLVRNGMCFAAIEVADAIDIDEAEDLEAARAMLGEYPEPCASGVGRG